jgi:hypothetical protein
MHILITFSAVPPFSFSKLGRRYAAAASSFNSFKKEYNNIQLCFDSIILHLLPVANQHFSIQ